MTDTPRGKPFILFNPLPAPSLTNDIKSIMKAGDLAWRRWKRHRMDMNYEFYKDLRNKARVAVQAANKETL